MSDQIDSAKAADPASPKESAMTLKEQLRHLLEHKGMSAAELSRKSGVSKQVISLWLAGSQPKSVVQVKAVADVLCVTLDHLLFGVVQESSVVDGGLEAPMGDAWMSGLFEVKFRRVKRR